MLSLSQPPKLKKLKTQELNPPPLSLYVHFPWCVKRCPYCDFNAHAAETTNSEISQDKAEAWLSAVRRDWQRWLSHTLSRPIISLFIGGGTPSLLPVSTLAALMRAISTDFDVSADFEATIECNPESVKREKLQGYFEAGINRVSIGVQSLQADQLQLLGRAHSSEQAREALVQAKEAGFCRINVDLMHALPSQDVASAKDDLHSILAMGVEHISWYSLTLEPNTAFFTRPPPLPSETITASIEDKGLELLQSEGFDRYEISAFARSPSHETRCRHNLNYWSFGDYLGVGPGAHSKITLLQEGVVRFAQVRSPESWLQDKPGKHHWLGEEDLLFEFGINAFRLLDGFDLETFEARTGLPASALDICLETALDKGWLEVSTSGKEIRPSALGVRFLNDLCGLLAPA